MEQILIFASYIIVALLGMGIVYVAPRKKPTYEEISDLEYKMRKEIEIQKAANFNLSAKDVYDEIIRHKTKPINWRCPLILVYLKNGVFAGARYGGNTVAHDLVTQDRNRIGEGIDYTHVVILQTGPDINSCAAHHKDMRSTKKSDPLSHGGWFSMSKEELLKVLNQSINQ